MLDKHLEYKDNNDIWVIRPGKYINLDKLSGLSEEFGKPIKEYQISDFAKYLLSPQPIEVNQRLIGFEVHYQQSWLGNIKNKISRILPAKYQVQMDRPVYPPKSYIARVTDPIPDLADKNFKAHIDNLTNKLLPYSTIIKQLKGLETSRISKILGICKDLGGNRSYLNIQGDIDSQINYLNRNLLKKVGARLDMAHIADGLFDIRGFDFSKFNYHNTHQLIKFMKDGKSRYCVMGVNDQPQYWVESARLISYAQLLEQSLRADIRLKLSLNQCVAGKAMPQKLFFNNKLEIEYSAVHMPRIYQKAIERCALKHADQDILLNLLPLMQIGISLNFIPDSDSGELKLVTDIAVLHDLRALEPLKEKLPQLFAEIDKIAVISDAGKFYLLDSIRGYQNEK